MAFIKYILNNKYFKISPRDSDCKVEANKSSADDNLKNWEPTVSYLPESSASCLPDSSAGCLPNSSDGCLPNVWKIKDPFEPHSSLVREIIEESNQCSTTSSLDGNISKIGSEYIEVSANVNDIKTYNNSSDLIENVKQLIPVNFENYGSSNEINKDRNLSALVQNSEMVGVMAQQFQTNFENSDNVNDINKDIVILALVDKMVDKISHQFQTNSKNTYNINETNNSNSVSALIKNDEMVGENAQQFQDNVNENNLSALINRDKLLDDIAEKYYDNFSDTSTNSERSFKTAKSCVSNRHCFNKNGNAVGQSKVESLCYKQREKSIKKIKQFHLKSDTFEMSHKNDCADQLKDICKKLLDPNSKINDLKNLLQRIQSSEFNCFDEMLSSQPKENDKLVCSKTQFLTGLSQNSEVNDSDQHLDSAEQIESYSDISKYKVKEEKSVYDIDETNDLNVCCKSSDKIKDDHLPELIGSPNSNRDLNFQDDFGENFVLQFVEPEKCNLDITNNIADQDRWHDINEMPDLNMMNEKSQAINKGNLLKRNLPSNSNRDNKRFKVNSIEQNDMRINDAPEENMKDETPFSDKSNRENQILKSGIADPGEQNEPGTSKDNASKETSVYNINKTPDLNMIPKESAAVNDGHQLRRNLPSNYNCYNERLKLKSKQKLKIQINDFIKEKDSKEIHLKTRYLVNGSPSPHSNTSHNENQNLNIDGDDCLELNEGDNLSGKFSKMIDLNGGLKSFDEESGGNLSKRIRSSDSNCNNKRLKLELEEKSNKKTKYSNVDSRSNPNDSDENFRVPNNQEHENRNIGIFHPVCSFQQNTLGYKNNENTNNKVTQNKNYTKNIKMTKTINNSSVNEHENEGMFPNNSVSPSQNCNTYFHPSDNNYKSISSNNIFSNNQDTLQVNRSHFLFYNRYNMVSNSTQTDQPNMNNSGNSDKTNIDDTLSRDDTSKHSIHNISINSVTDFVELPKQKHAHNESHEEKYANTIESQAPSNYNTFQNIGESALGEYSFETANTSKSTATVRSTESYLSKESIEKLNEYYSPQQAGDHNRNPNLVEYVNDWMKSSSDPVTHQNTTCISEGNKIKPEGNLNGEKKLKSSKAGKNPRKRKTNKSGVHKAKRKSNAEDGLSNFACPLILKRPVRQESQTDFFTSTLKPKAKHLTSENNRNNEVPQQVGGDNRLTSKSNSNDQIEKQSQMIPQNTELQTFVVKTPAATNPIETIKLVNDGQEACTSKSTEKSGGHDVITCGDKLSETQSNSVNIRPPRKAKTSALLKLKQILNEDQEAGGKKSGPKRNLKTATKKLNCCNNQLPEFQSSSVISRPPRKAKTDALLKFKNINFIDKRNY